MPPSKRPKNSKKYLKPFTKPQRIPKKVHLAEKTIFTDLPKLLNTC